MTNENAKPSVGLPPGTRIGKYEVTERLAIGGQAIIYKCYDSLLDRHVAVKQISSHLAEDPAFLDRFRKEAQTLARLGAKEPGIVTIYELVEDERGLFIVMEHVQGNSLEKILNENADPIEPKATLQILWRLAGALYSVHSAGIIHRDIKPANIIISDGLRPRIADFGVAASLTGQTSMLLGTTKYMAPELVSGAGFDGRADIYSLGFIAYEMLAGRAKFKEIFADVVRDKHSESLRWMKWHSNKSVQAPKLNLVNPAVPEALADIVARMLAKDPAERFESMEALGRAIKTQFSPKAKAAPADAAEEARRHTRRHRRKGQAAAIPVATISGGTGADGEELELSPEGPATAQLPKRKLTRRMKLVILVVALFVTLAGVIAISSLLSGNERQRERVRRDLSASMITAFNDGLYDQSIEKAHRLQAEFGGSIEAAKASVYQPLSEAFLAIDQTEWPTVDERLKQASDRRTELLTREGLKDWARDMEEPIQLANTRKQFRNTYFSLLAESRDLFKRASFVDARKKIDEPKMKEAVEKGGLPDRLKTELLQYRRQIDVAEFTAQVDAAIAEADKLAGEGNIPAARSAYDAAVAKLDEGGLKHFDREKVDTIKTSIQSKKSDLMQKLTLGEARKAVADARAAGNKNDEIMAIQALLELEKTQALQDRLAQLQAEVAYADGKTKETEGLRLEGEKKFGPAQQAYVAARELLVASNGHKVSTAATAAIALVDQHLLRGKLMRDAITDFNHGRFAEAQKKFEQADAVPSPSSQSIAAYIRDCKYEIIMAEAGRLHQEANKLAAEQKHKEAQEKYAASLAKYEEARKVNPAKDAQVGKLQEAVKTDYDYGQYVAEGEQLLVDKKWDAAKVSFEKAKALKPGAEIDARISFCSYAKYRALGREMLDANNKDAARSYFQTAKKYAVKPEEKKEIETLIGQTVG